MDSDGGGWTVIMKRKGTQPTVSTVSFNRVWDQYENGFGNLNTEFWMGLRNIHCLTTREDVDLMIDLRDNFGSGLTWIYHLFRVNGSDDKYRLQIGQSEGPPGGYDAMAFHNGKQFSTHNMDNDGVRTKNCANEYRGGWWFGHVCFNTGSFLTGTHIVNVNIYNQWQRPLWFLGQGASNFIGSYRYYPNIAMKIRPKNCAAVCKKP